MIVVIFLLMAIYVVWLINKTTVKSVYALLDADSRVEKVYKVDDAYFDETFNEVDARLRKLGFVFDCMFQEHVILKGDPMRVASWWQPQDKVFALLYVVGERHSVDFVSRFPKDISIVTGSSKDAMMLPCRDKEYRQAFPKLDIEALYQRHENAMVNVQVKHELIGAFEKYDIIKDVKNTMKAQAKHVMSLPLWMLRGIFWYFVRRNMLVNREVKP